jgi:AraC-like DNA-binding protein
MIYAVHRPSPPLDHFIAHMWFFDGYDVDHTMERLLPDATTEIVINLRPEPKSLYHRDNFDDVQLFKKSWISGKQTRYIVIEAAKESSMMGVHFNPCGVFPFLGFGVSELTDQVLELDLLWGGTVNFLREQLLDTPTVAGKFALLESFLASRFRGHPRTFRSVERAMQLMLRSPHGMAIRDFAAAIGITPKHLITQFDRFVGLKPKLCERIGKFQSVLGAVENHQRVDWAHVAAACGYYDQSHFIKEFKNFSGINPSVYLVDRSEYANYVPIY